jgi:hypothetical protein
MVELELMVRLLLAGILGALVGFEREKRFKEAGLRTHFLVLEYIFPINISSPLSFRNNSKYAIHIYEYY